jgi:antitoxin (DNA-binding transcriptional repressor) of toxin-antitoxin stability system
MQTDSISAQELRERLPLIIKSLASGKSYTLIYRSRPVGQLLPLAKKPHPRSKAFLKLAHPNRSLLFKHKKSAVALIQAERS